MARRKETGFGREVSRGHDGATLWEAGGIAFRWTGRPGINLYCRVQLDDGWQPLVYCATLAHAGMFAEGLSAGIDSERRRLLEEGGAQ